MENLRLIALETLLYMEKSGEPCNKVLKQVLDKYAYLEKRDRSFLKRLIDGTLERRLELDHVISIFSKTPVKKLRPVIREILRLSVYQILYMDSVPDRACVNEGVRLAVIKGFSSLKGYVNGVLRSICTGKDKITWPDRGEKPSEYLSIRYSMPEFIVRYLLESYDEKTVEEILAAELEARPLFIRANHMKCRDRELKEILLKEGIHAEEVPMVKGAYKLLDPERVSDNSAFGKGFYTVMDIGSMLAALLSGAKEGDRVIDVCAAPGGKTSVILDMLGGSGEVVARDISDEKLKLIEENMERLGYLGNINIVRADAREFSKEYEGAFDIVTADLPCTGLGVISRKTDIKYRLRPESFEELQRLQREILRTVWRYLKPGGVLMYSTCTLGKKENIDNFEWLKSEFPLKPVSLEEDLGEGLKETEEGCIELLPGQSESDGFFIAKLKRI